jgi:ribonuclease P protein component
MKKINIIRKSSEFERMLKIRTKYRTDCFSIYIEKNSLSLNRFGITVPKKLGNAVTRNHLKRRIKSIIDKYNFNINCIDYIIVAKSKLLELDYSIIKSNLESLLEKIEKEV